MKRIYVELLKQQLIQHHQYADTYIGVWDPQKNDWVINGNNGKYEWDNGKWNQDRQKYVSLTCYLHQWDNEYFKQAYKELVEDGILEPLEDKVRHKWLYKYLGIDYKECNEEIFKDVWDKGPSCPTELMKQDEVMKKSQWWIDLKEEFHKLYKGNTSREELVLHHKTNEAYSKCLLCFNNNLTPEKAYEELKNDLELLTDEEHCKVHNRPYKGDKCYE